MCDPSRHITHLVITTPLSFNEATFLIENTLPIHQFTSLPPDSHCMFITDWWDFYSILSYVHVKPRLRYTFTVTHCMDKLKQSWAGCLSRAFHLSEQASPLLILRGDLGWAQRGRRPSFRKKYDKTLLFVLPQSWENTENVWRPLVKLKQTADCFPQNTVIWVNSYWLRGEDAQLILPPHTLMFRCITQLVFVKKKKTTT